MEPISMGGLFLASLLAGATGTGIAKVHPSIKNFRENLDKQNEELVRSYLAKGIEVPEAFAPTLQRIKEKDQKNKKDAKPEPISNDTFLKKIKQSIAEEDQRYAEKSAIFAKQKEAEQAAYDIALAKIINNYEFGLLTSKERDKAIKALKPVSQEPKEFIPHVQESKSFGAPTFFPNK